MSDYKRVPTSAEVWAVIRARHHGELRVFSSFSAPEGDYYGDSDEGRMTTEYGFKDADYPLMGADTRWDIDREKPSKRNNERHEYWLCLPVKEDAT